MLTFNPTRTRIDNKTNRYLNAYLRGREQPQHPPLSPEEIAQVYRVIRRQVAETIEAE